MTYSAFLPLKCVRDCLMVQPVCDHRGNALSKPPSSSPRSGHTLLFFLLSPVVCKPSSKHRSPRNYPRSFIKTLLRDFPHGPVIKNLPFNAGDAGSIPGWGIKIPHVIEQLSLCTSVTQYAHSGTHVLQLDSPRASTSEPVSPNC